MTKERKPVHKVVMTEGKRDIIRQMLLNIIPPHTIRTIIRAGRKLMIALPRAHAIISLLPRFFALP